MGISKQDFYEGAALHLLARPGKIISILSRPPFYLLNGRVAVLLKYSTKGRSPWGFTVTANEQAELDSNSSRLATTTIGLICGSDGVVPLPYKLLKSIAVVGNGPIHISCYRNHGEFYEVNGPLGMAPNKIAPSSWSKLLDVKMKVP